MGKARGAVRHSTTESLWAAMSIVLRLRNLVQMDKESAHHVASEKGYKNTHSKKALLYPIPASILVSVPKFGSRWLRPSGSLSHLLVNR